MPRDSQQLDEIQEAKERRLHHLELRQAREGNDTPPEVLIEIDDIRRQLAPVQAVTNTPVSDSTLDAMTAYGRLEATMRAVMTLTADVSELKSAFARNEENRVNRQHSVDMKMLALFFTMLFLAILVIVT